MTIKLIIGLGNPGQNYSGTRHNAGHWFVEALLAECQPVTLSTESKFQAQVGTALYANQKIKLALPTTYMNLSGSPTRKLLDYFNLLPENLLVAHDEVAFEPGIARFKYDGGHNGHNGLRHIIECLGGRRDFYRLRIGIGHPGSKDLTTDYVLSRPSKTEQQSIERAIQASLQELPTIVNQGE